MLLSVPPPPKGRVNPYCQGFPYCVFRENPKGQFPLCCDSKEVRN